jgi:hypothetical protein
MHDRAGRDSAAERLKPVTIEALLARSDLEVGIAAPLRGWARTGLTRTGTVMGAMGLMITVLPPLAVRIWMAVRQRVS